MVLTYMDIVLTFLIFSGIMDRWIHRTWWSL